MDVRLTRFPDPTRCTPGGVDAPGRTHAATPATASSAHTCPGRRAPGAGDRAATPRPSAPRKRGRRGSRCCTIPRGSTAATSCASSAADLGSWTFRAHRFFSTTRRRRLACSRSTGWSSGWRPTRTTRASAPRSACGSPAPRCGPGGIQPLVKRALAQHPAHSAQEGAARTEAQPAVHLPQLVRGETLAVAVSEGQVGPRGPPGGRRPGGVGLDRVLQGVKAVLLGLAERPGQPHRHAR